MNYFLDNDLFSNRQYGFLKGRSTVLQLLNITDTYLTFCMPCSSVISMQSLHLVVGVAASSCEQQSVWPGTCLWLLATVVAGWCLSLSPLDIKIGFRRTNWLHIFRFCGHRGIHAPVRTHWIALDWTDCPPSPSVHIYFYWTGVAKPGGEFNPYVTHPVAATG